MEMKVTANSYGSAAATLLVIFAAACAVLVLVHLVGTAQLPGAVPDCGAESVLDALSQECQRVTD
jgi:hypothetical protein